MREKKTEDGSTLRERFSKRYGDEAFDRGRELIVLRGKCGATLYGCKKILWYSPCEIRLRMATRTVSVVGEKLYCSSFSAGTVTVNGYVTGVSYVSDQEGKGSKA